MSETKVPSSAATELEGSWPKGDLRRAFVEGAKWWQYKANESTAFASEVRKMEREANKRYPLPDAPQSETTATEGDAYVVEQENNGCQHCFAGRSYIIVGPDGVALGRSWEDADEVAQFAACLNEAFHKGQASNTPQSSTAATEPRDVLLGESLLEYTIRNFNELCSAWSDVRDHNGEINAAKCDYAAAKERVVRSAIHELAALRSATAAPKLVPAAKADDAKGGWKIDFKFLDELCDNAALKDEGWRVMPEAAEAVIMALADSGHVAVTDSGGGQNG